MNENTRKIFNTVFRIVIFICFIMSVIMVINLISFIIIMDKDDPGSLISELRVSEAKKLIQEGFVGGGMIPKLANCIEAIENGVNRVHILDGRIPHSLLLEIFTNKGIGTAILRDDLEKYNGE